VGEKKRRTGKDESYNRRSRKTGEDVTNKKERTGMSAGEPRGGGETQDPPSVGLALLGGTLIGAP